MPNIIKIDLSDKYRTLLTDVLPYELPLWYNNYNMYNCLKNNLSNYMTVSTLKNKISENLIPFNYKVFRGENKSPRVLSIIHPLSQLHVCDFYEKYATIIEYYCSKSDKSLRYPFKIATSFYGKVNKMGAQKKIDSIEMYEDDPKTASSYFKYLKYPFLYRFFESYEYHKLEKRFNHMMQVDISKCFPNIYTHSIGWATKNKRLAKNRSNGSFEHHFDTLMQNTNYKETNGIVVGPEVCRIFAEIILQQIDIDIVKILKSKYEDGIDYEIRRYVDDYFIFYRSLNVGEAVHLAISDALEKYKLHLNEAKTEYIVRPFTTKISITKNNIKNTIHKLFNYKTEKNGEIHKINYPDRKANQIISKIKMVIFQNNVLYSSISNYLIKSIENQFTVLINEINGLDKKEEHHLNWILVDLDVLFFFYAMDIRVRTTDKIAKQVEFLLTTISTWKEETIKEVIYKKIFDLIKQAIDIFLITKGELYGLEILNLLVLLTLLPVHYQLDVNRLDQYYLRLIGTTSEDDFYFIWVTFLLYIKNNNVYDEIKSKLITLAKDYLTNNKDLFNSSHYFILFFDFASCPYVEKNIRSDVINKVKKINKANYKDKTKDYILNNDFIVQWKKTDYLQNSLNKREFIFSYE
ncbi:MAG: RNA-directed DNA polymerase [Gilliamella sp.]|uniref:antiviral reverse transcriptase Drt3b n=1 Tax=Gilliamella sp. TaxID=1891236 RepID=UPI0026142D76|nr:antiviral reverse transcriptase Drt3b [Gilliamella sp.]MCO6551904.1 RNA-directed DNA polymerase [Gilliamella sp.]